MSLSTRKVPQHDYIVNAQLIPHESRNTTIPWCHHLIISHMVTTVGNKAKLEHTLELIKRTLHATDRSVRKSACEILVRLFLEYATCTWSPHTQKDKQCLENIQWAAARFMCGDYGKRSSITQIMDQLGWDTLTTRRLCREAIGRDATMLYKVVHLQQGWHPPTRP